MKELEAVKGNLRKRRESSIWYRFSKRGLDVIASTLALIVLSPIMLGVAIAIKIESNGPVIFKQKRIGLNGKEFYMYKFRSMVINAEEIKKTLTNKNESTGPMFKIKNDPRITKVGRFIRKTSIDELPQLVNILRNEMSIVGPRPSLPHEVDKFEDWMLERLDVKPGLTCYWQVMGRNSIGFEKWMELDVKYVKEKNFFLDLKLIFKTLFVFLGDENAS